MEILKKSVIVLFLCAFTLPAPAQHYWNDNTVLTPFRLPLVSDRSSIRMLDLDGDGDPDVMYAIILGDLPIMWVDDGDVMQWDDTEGDMQNGALFIDVNRDGIFGGPWDFCVKRADTNGNGLADVQITIRNQDPEHRQGFDWTSDLMIIIDHDEQGIFSHIDWNIQHIRTWKRYGHSNFYTDFHGNITFTRMCVSVFRVDDFRYSLENPFLFWDHDGNGYTDMSMRLLDNPYFRADPDSRKHFENQPEHVDAVYSRKITYAAIALDLDNDSGPGSEFDFDMSLLFQGEGFDYTDQVNPYPQLRGLPEADKLIYDAAWRQVTELIFPNRDNAWDLTFNRGKWNCCRFVFDEDDDCNRWERVEFYHPKDIFKIGMNGGGLDDDPQADPIGDRGEFDEDNSGGGRLYIAPFDGRLHLYGAEWGAWRIDQQADLYQGYGGLYDIPVYERIMKDPEKWGTVKYTDTDNNGFFDVIEYDLDGDRVFEDRVSLKELGLDDSAFIYETKEMQYADFTRMFTELSDRMWERAQQAVVVAGQYGVNSSWYAFWKFPRTVQERYSYGYWLAFYIYKDLCDLAVFRGDTELKRKFDIAYYSGTWEL